MFYKQEVEESYQALADMSEQFREEISFECFTAALLNVWTRSFGTGPLVSLPVAKDGELANNEDQDLYQELLDYKEHTGIDLLSHGCHSMVPILDLYNHFGTNPNVGFSYNTSKQAFVVTTTTRIKKGQEIFDSYGKHSEAHLFAKYGFVNQVVGSDYTQASLALYHPVYSKTTSGEQFSEDSDSILSKQMIRYMQFDDGYQECVSRPHKEHDVGINDKEEQEADKEKRDAWEFKRLKFQHLLRIARNVQRWNVFLSPRSPKAKPPLQSVPAPSAELESQRPNPWRIPKFVPSKVQVDVHHIFSTCRLLVMTHHDYEGNATTILSEGLASNSVENLVFTPPRSEGEPLQFRELMCILRFADMALNAYYNLSRKKQMDGNGAANKVVTSIEDQIAWVQELNEKEQHAQQQSQGSYQQGVEWRTAHLQLAEMQALRVLKEISAQMIQNTFGHEESQSLLNSEPSYSMRKAPCPLSHQMELLK